MRQATGGDERTGFFHVGTRQYAAHDPRHYYGIEPEDALHGLRRDQQHAAACGVDHAVISRRSRRNAGEARITLRRLGGVVDAHDHGLEADGLVAVTCPA